jgi:hypothetical protein
MLSQHKEIQSSYSSVKQESTITEIMELQYNYSYLVCKGNFMEEPSLYIKKNWVSKYKGILDDIFNLNKGSENTQEVRDYYSRLAQIFDKYHIHDISKFIRGSEFHNIDNKFIYSLSNLLSKYPEICNKKAVLHYSLTDENDILLNIVKENNYRIKNEKYVSKLTLIFFSSGKIYFSSSDSNDNYFVKGEFDSSKSLLKNSNIRRVLGFIDEY